MRTSYLLIANPISGGDARSKIRQAIEWFEKRHVQVDVFLTSARGDATRAAADAREKNYQKIVVAGGDGTLNEVINGLGSSPVPLAFLPLGTVNVFALETGIPLALEDACRVAHQGRSQQICLGMAGETCFLLMAGIGFDAAAVYGLDARLKRWAGKLAYVVSAMSILFGPAAAPFEMTLPDGRVEQGFSAIIGNGRYYGGRFSLTPEADLREATLQICLFKRWGRFRLLRIATLVAAGRPLRPPDVELVKTDSVIFRGGDAPVQTDGDYLGRLPMTFRVAPYTLNMLLPDTREKP